jgi:hypothetical protein
MTECEIQKQTLKNILAGMDVFSHKCWEHVGISDNLPPMHVNLATPSSHCPHQPPSPTASASRHSYICSCQLIKNFNQPDS